MQRTSSLPFVVLLAALTATIAGSWLRYTSAPAYRDAKRTKREASERVVYYRIDATKGPSFRLIGGEKSIRIITHLALSKTVAWPPERYDPLARYDYGLRIVLRDVDGHEHWRREVHLKTRQSKADFDGERWRFEQAYDEDGQFEVSDSRIVHLDLPNRVPVDAVLELRFIGESGQFALATAYRLGELDRAEQELRPHQLSLQDKALLVEDTTYLDWEEIDPHRRDDRLKLRMERLGAVTDSDIKPISVPILISPFRLPPPERQVEASQWLLDPWQRSYVISGPARIWFHVEQPAASLGQNSIYYPKGGELLVQDLAANAVSHLQRFPISFDTSTSTPRNRDVALDLAAGVHSLQFRWIPQSAPVLPSSNALQGRPTHALPARRQMKWLAPAAELSLRIQSLAASDIAPMPLQGNHMADGTAFADPVLTRYYYLGPDSSPLSFPVEAGDEMSRALRVEVRAWDVSTQSPALLSPLMLDYAFLSETGNTLHRSQARAEQPFDPASWVEFRTIELERPVKRNYALGLSEVQSWTVVAPAGSQTIELSSQQPCLLRVSGWASSPSDENLLQPPFDAVELNQTRWRMAPHVRQKWLPMRPSQHAAWYAQGWVVDVASQLRLESIEAPQEDYEDQAWDALVPKGRHNQQAVLERLEFAGVGDSIARPQPPTREQIWKKCPACWSELSAGIDYLIDDAPEILSDPFLVLQGAVETPIATNIRTRLETPDLRFVVDQSPQSTQWKAMFDRRRLPELSGAPHRFLWESTLGQARVWINRRARPVKHLAGEASIPVYGSRNLYQLSAKPMQFIIQKPNEGSLAVNFKFYRKPKGLPAVTAAISTPTARPLSFLAQVDGGNPGRAVGLFADSLTQGRRVIDAAPSDMAQLIFLDDEQSGVFESLAAVVVLGSDLRPGWHRVTIWSKDPGEVWVRAFTREVATPAPSTHQWKTFVPSAQQ